MSRQVSLGRVVGSTIRNGNVLPTSYAGWLEGDIFVLNDTENNAISYYVYSNGKLTKKGNLSGEKGDIGLQGIPGVGVYSYSGAMQLFYSGNIDISKVALPQGRKLQVGDIVISNAIETTGVYAMITRIESETTAVYARAYGTLKGDNGTSIFATTAALPDSGTTAINTINIIKPDSKDVQTGDLIVSDNEETPGHYGMVETLYVQGAYMYASIKYIGHIIGEKGVPGENGKAGTITIGEVNTGLPGTDVIVTNTGTEGDAILNFTIPAGKESVIDLGVITEDPASATNSVLSEIFSTGIYKFEYEYTSAPGITNQAYLMYVFNKYGALCQNIICSGNQFIQRIYRGDEGWIIEEGSFATREEMLIASKQTTATNTSDKIFLIGSKSQYSIGTSTYSHDTVYVDTDGHLYDSGKRVLTTADNVSGGAVSGDYLPKSGGIMTGDIIFDKNKAKGIRVASYNTSGEEQLNQVILTSDTTQTIVGNKQQDNVKLLGSDAPVWNDGTNEHTILTSKGGTINGNLSVGGNLVMNGGGNISGDSASFHTMNVATKLNLSNTKKITYDDTYEYIFPDKSGTVALLSDIPSGGGGKVSGEQIAIQEFFSNSTYTYKTDFDWSKLTLDNFDEYCVIFLRFNGGNHEILKPEKIFASSIGNTYYFENTVIGIKVVMSSTGKATISTYITNSAIASKLVANNHITQSGLSATYPTINKSGVYLININWGGYSETQVVMWLEIDNPDILFSSPFQINFKDQTYNQLRWANNLLTLIDQSSNPVNITNITITAKLIREY